MKPLHRKTLVLNADCRPFDREIPDNDNRLIETWPLTLIDARDAVSAIWRDRVNVLENWPDEWFRSPSTRIAVPKTIALREYVRIESKPKFCRRSIILRDGFECQYCGEQFASEELTYDHVKPRSRGGLTVWDNIVCACLTCNALKRDRTPQEAGMWPKNPPRQPTNYQLLEAGLRHLPNDVREDWLSWLYWNVEVGNG